MSILENLKARTDKALEKLQGKLLIAQEESKKLKEVGPKIYAQNIKEQPEIYGILSEENLTLLERLASDYQWSSESQGGGVTEYVAQGLDKFVIKQVGIETRILTMNGDDPNKSASLKGIKKGLKYFK